MTHDSDDIDRRNDTERDRTRTKRGLPLASLVDELGIDSELLKRDDAWWARRDREVGAQRETALREELAEERRRRAQMLKGEDYGFPAVAVDGALAVFPAPTAAIAHVERFATGPRSLLVLAGGVGTGKTTAATRLALDDRGPSPAFLRATELEARGRYDKDLRAWLRGRSMLVLDDLGAEVLDGKNVFRSLLDEVVDLFYGARRRLVITTNLAMRRRDAREEPQLAERYGERIVSRLAEVGAWGDCGARDLRREASR